MRLYVASSWRNTIQPQVVEILRGAAHDVYDFRNPREGENGFHWSEIDPEWKTWSPERYRDCLLHPIAEAGFASDMDALRWCEGVVAVQPFGRSASLELGWAAGAGKLTILLLADGEPDLMVKMCDHVCVDMAEVLDVLNHAVVHNAKFSRDSSGWARPNDHKERPNDKTIVGCNDIVTEPAGSVDVWQLVCGNRWI